MDVFLTVLENRAPKWNAQIGWLFAISLAFLCSALLICGVKKRRVGGIAFLYFYLYNVLVTTLLMREPFDEVRCTLRINFLRQIFVEHSQYAAAESFLNFLMLFPVGLFMPLFFDRYRTLKTCLFGFAFTMFIECTQLVTHLGEFQSDDLILNYLGCCAGAWLCELAGYIRSGYREKAEKIRIIENIAK